MKRSFYQAAVVSKLLYGCTTRTLKKRLDKKLDGNYTRMLRAILNISPGGNTPQGTNYTTTCLPSRNLSKLDEPGTQDTAGEAETSSQVMYSYGPPHMAEQKQDDQVEQIYSSYVRIREVTLKTCQRQWTIGKSGERGSGISVLVVWYDDDDDDIIQIIHFKRTVKEFMVLLLNTNTSIQHFSFSCTELICSKYCYILLCITDNLIWQSFVYAQLTRQRVQFPTIYLNISHLLAYCLNKK